MLKRVLTAVAGIPAVILIICNSGEKVFFIFALIVTAWALKEFYWMTLSGQSIWGRTVSILLGCYVIISVFLDSQISTGNNSSSYLLTTGSCALSLIVLFIYHIFSSHEIKKTFDQLIVKVFGVFYIALLFSYVILLRAHDRGIELLLFLVFVTWAGDTGAYIIGSWKGKRALCMKISPKKTIEGSAGSIVSGILVAFLCKIFFLEQLSLFHCLVLGVGINFLNQIGDLSESMIKRAFQIKDSGSVLPGHGGMLDRIDSLLFAAPFLFYYVQIIIPKL